MNLLAPRSCCLLVGLTAVAASAVAHAAFPAQPDQFRNLDGGKEFVYRTVGELELKLHVFEPKERSETPRPAIVFFFGGGWVNGAPWQFGGHAKYFAERGMVAACADYRTQSRHHTTPFECVADGQAAVAWLREHAQDFHVDPDRIAAAGGSAGGHVAACTAILTPQAESAGCRPQALILFNPVLDTTPKGYGAQILGQRARELSPVHHLRAGLPPTIVFHGEADVTVPFENAERFAQQMRECGNTCQLEAFPKQGHGFYWKEPHLAQSLQVADRFLTQLGWLKSQ